MRENDDPYAAMPTSPSPRCRPWSMSDFKTLKVWRESHQLAIATVKITARMRGSVGSLIRNQWMRAATSVPTNIAEGSAKQSDRDFIRFLRIARGSLTESEYHLILATDLGLIASQTAIPMNDRIQAVGKMLSGLIPSMEKKDKPLATRD